MHVQTRGCFGDYIVMKVRTSIPSSVRVALARPYATGGGGAGVVTSGWPQVPRIVFGFQTMARLRRVCAAMRRHLKPTVWSGVLNVSARGARL